MHLLFYPVTLHQTLLQIGGQLNLHIELLHCGLQTLNLHEEVVTPFYLLLKRSGWTINIKSEVNTSPRQLRVHVYEVQTVLATHLVYYLPRSLVRHQQLVVSHLLALNHFYILIYHQLLLYYELF